MGEERKEGENKKSDRPMYRGQCPLIHYQSESIQQFFDRIRFRAKKISYDFS